MLGGQAGSCFFRIKAEGGAAAAGGQDGAVDEGGRPMVCSSAS